MRQEGSRAGPCFPNCVLPVPPAVESTKVGLTSIETMMDKMHADCKIEQENEQFTMTLLFPVEKSNPLSVKAYGFASSPEGGANAAPRIEPA